MVCLNGGISFGWVYLGIRATGLRHWIVGHDVNVSQCVGHSRWGRARTAPHVSDRLFQAAIVGGARADRRAVGELDRARS